jgi:hypothetical protein
LGRNYWTMALPDSMRVYWLVSLTLAPTREQV